MKYKAVLWDFYGVWSKDVFYKSIKSLYPDVWDFIQKHIWEPEGSALINKWMRAEVTAEDINKYISDNTGINYELLTEIFYDDAAKIEVEMGHVPVVVRLKTGGIKVGMITNNVDIFGEVIVPKLDLMNLFNRNVFCSFDYRMTKARGLFEKVKNKMDLEWTSTLLIDDSDRARAAFEKLGGQTYTYTTFEDFKVWADKNLLI